MDTTKASKLIELTKDSKKIIVTLWKDNKISSCVTSEKKRHCETCEGDEELCAGWIGYLKDKGYTATEVELTDLETEESLPRFLEERQASVKPEPVAQVEPEVVTEVQEESAEEADAISEPD